MSSDASGCSWTRYKIYQPSFQARYIHFFSHETEQNLQHAYPWQNLDAASLKWLPLLFIMVSLSSNPSRSMVSLAQEI
jgi:hypothetical protein